MPEYVTGRPWMVTLLFENLMESHGIIKLIHDGNATGSPVYTRKYEIYIKGKETGCHVKFIYNRRNNWSEITMTYSDLMGLKLAEIFRGVYRDYRTGGLTFFKKEAEGEKDISDDTDIDNGGCGDIPVG